MGNLFIFGKNKKWAELSEMVRTLIKKIRNCFLILGDLKGGGFRVLACADTGARTPLDVRQY
jgi:hypothetical protein